MDLIKKLNTAKAVVYDLAKKEGLGNQEAYCMFAIDTSGSMSSLFRGGWVQKVTERLLPIAMAFDDDGAMEVFEFSSRAKQVPTSATSANITNYVNDFMRPDFNSTNYAPVLRMILDDYKSKTGQKTGLMGMFNKAPKEILPAFVTVIVDGNCDDRRETEALIKEMRSYGIYLMFVGVSAYGEVAKGTFPFLEKLDDLSGNDLDNAGYFGISTAKLENMADSDFYPLMMKEFPNFVKSAKGLKIIS